MADFLVDPRLDLTCPPPGGRSQDYLWSVEFALHAFAWKFARHGEVCLAASTIARCVHALILVRFALNRRYPANDKATAVELSECPRCPPGFRNRVEVLLSRVRGDAAELEQSEELLHALFEEVVALSGELYAAKYDFAEGAV